MAKSQRSSGFWNDGIALVRVTIGIMMIVHGWQLFERHDMTLFTELLFNMSLPFPEAMAYTGKIIELAGGGFLVLGLFTRVMTFLLFITFMVITFVVGDGKVFSDNQLPFLYALVCLTFFFTGAGRISIDFLLFSNRGDDEDGITSKGFGRYVSRS